MKTISFHNYKILIGENSKENWLIIDKSDSFDLWFHIDDSSSCHVIAQEDLRSLEKIDVNMLINECAKLCRENTPKLRGKKVIVIYTTVSNIRKCKEIGSVEILEEKDVKKIKLI